MCRALAVAVLADVFAGSASSGWCDTVPLSVGAVTPENAERITYAKKFFPSIGTIIICNCPTAAPR